ncbi:MAG: acyl-CoA dehydrogenase family protein [Alphaproteobacteria bacterium]|nr:acyl-CoA dehydrogenase family protein [Alphaproteobacteria bacterium]
MADSTFLDWPFFDPAHHDFARRLEDWAAKALGAGKNHREDELDATCRDLVARLAAAGWLKCAVPAPFGSALEKLDVRQLCLAREILARHDALADFAFAMQGLGSAPIALFGTPEQQRRYLPDVAVGRRIAAFALSEQDAGSDVAAITTTARRDGDAYVIDGGKTWISNGGIADFYVVFARTGEAPGARGLSAFVVDAGTPGLAIAERIAVVAPHPLATLRFDGLRVPVSHRLGGPGEGFKVAMATLDVFRSTVGAAALGFARRALDETLARVKARQVMGQALAEFQLTQQKLAEMAVAIDAAALLVYRAAWTRDTKAARVTREAAMAKLYATEAAQRVIDHAVQLHGGMGVVAGAPVERLYREIRSLRIYEGTSEVQQLVIAGQVLRQGG